MRSNTQPLGDDVLIASIYQSSGYFDVTTVDSFALRGGVVADAWLQAASYAQDRCWALLFTSLN